MKILLIGINYLPELTGIGKYSGEMAEWLASKGHEVHVLTAAPYYPEWRVRPGYSSMKYQRERIGEVSVIRCPIWVPRNPSGFKRILHLASFGLSSLFPGLVQCIWRPDLVIAIEPPLLGAPVALLIAKASKAKAWLHIHDYEIDAAFALNLLPSKRIRSWVNRAEKMLLSGFDRVSTISESMLAKLGPKGVPGERQVLFANWADIERLQPDPAGGLAFREALHIGPLEKLVLYSGNLGEKQGVEIIIEAARLIEDRHDIHFLICGNGAAEERLKRSAAGLKRLRFLPLQPQAQFRQMLNAADIHLLPQKADAADLVMPSKLTGILAVGGFVIATAHPDTELGRTVSVCGGRLVEPGDEEGLAQTIISSIDDRSWVESAYANAIAYAHKHLNKDSILSDFMKHARDLVETQRDD